MPRIYTSCDCPLDFCENCFPDEWDAQGKYGNLGDGPDGRGNCFAYDAEHPPYEMEEYECEVCGCVLLDLDN